MLELEGITELLETTIHLLKFPEIATQMAPRRLDFINIAAALCMFVTQSKLRI